MFSSMAISLSNGFEVRLLKRNFFLSATLANFTRSYSRTHIYAETPSHLRISFGDELIRYGSLTLLRSLHGSLPIVSVKPMMIKVHCTKVRWK